MGEQFWSGGAIELGDNGGKPVDAIKFTAMTGLRATPTSACVPIVKQWKTLGQLTDDNLLRTDAGQRMKAGPTCLTPSIQYQVDPAQQPIEDTSVERLTPFTQVATIDIPQVDLDGDPSAQQKEQFCDNLGFSPWHAMPDHRPLGNMMRARQQVYEVVRRCEGHRRSLRGTSSLRDAYRVGANSALAVREIDRWTR